MREQRTSVLVVGGGVVGLSTALFLAKSGVSVTLVEKHPGTSIHPRAWGWYHRTLELFRSAGIEQRVLQAAAGFADHRLNAKVESLLGKEISSVMLPDEDDLSDITPCRHVALGQDRMEPIVRAAAEEAGAELLFDTELVSLEQDADGVDAVVTNRVYGSVRKIRADYVVAADGARSPLRERLGVPAHGRGAFRHQVSILFRADLTGPLRGRRFSICQIENETVTAVLGHDDTLQEATLIVTFEPAKGESISDFTETRCIELVRAAIGSPDIDVTIRDVLPWEMAGLVAASFRVDRVFFAGDSAHIVPPIGGYGANLGIHDAHNLAWKLAAVLRGQAGPALLATYESERAPVAQLTVAQGGLRLAMRAGFATPEQKAQVLDPLAVTLGYRYPVPGSDADVPAPVHPDQLSGTPGTRAPHVWLAPGRSTVDLYGTGLVLLTGSADETWSEAAAKLTTRSGVPLTVHRDDRLTTPHGISPAGAVLVRPDGFIAWRTPATPDEPDTALATAVSELLARPDII